MTGDNDEKRKVKRKLYILDFRKNFQFLAYSSTKGWVVFFSRDIEPFHPFIVRADLASGRDFHLAAERAWTFRFWILLHFWTNCGTSRMESSKAPKSRDSRLCQVTARDRSARKPLGKGECSPRYSHCKGAVPLGGTFKLSGLAWLTILHKKKCLKRCCRWFVVRFFQEGCLGRIVDTTPPSPVQDLRLTWRQGLDPRIAVKDGLCTFAQGTASGIPSWKLRLRLNSVSGVVVK